MAKIVVTLAVATATSSNEHLLDVLRRSTTAPEGRTGQVDNADASGLGKLSEKHEATLRSAQRKISSALLQEQNLQEAWKHYRRQADFLKLQSDTESENERRSRQRLAEALNTLLVELYHALVVAPRLIDDTSLHSVHHGPRMAHWVEVLQGMFESKAPRVEASGPQQAGQDGFSGLSGLTGTLDELESIGEMLDLNTLRAALRYSRSTISLRLAWNTESAFKTDAES
ncbi:hypothetical protein [Amycolatopsis sp. WGS_07]|uniref:hypothetical protein n=1 Tax=Amycolatopsis sp. WGS_07 TaxID=3076764 RepID=UPI003872A7A8